MAESENSVGIFGNKDVDKLHPLKNDRDLLTYVIKGTPVKKIQVGKQFKTVTFDEAATVRCYLPEDYERLVMRDFFNKNTNVSYTILNDPTQPQAETASKPKAETTQKKKRTRRTPEQIAADEEAKMEAEIAAEEAEAAETAEPKEEVNNG